MSIDSLTGIDWMRYLLAKEEIDIRENVQPFTAKSCQQLVSGITRCICTFTYDNRIDMSTDEKAQMVKDVLDAISKTTSKYALEVMK